MPYNLNDWQDEHLPFIKWWVMRDGTAIGVCHMRTGHVIHTINTLRKKNKKAGSDWRRWVTKRLMMELDIRGVDYQKNWDNPEGPYK